MESAPVLSVDSLHFTFRSRSSCRALTTRFSNELWKGTRNGHYGSAVYPATSAHSGHASQFNWISLACFRWVWHRCRVVIGLVHTWHWYLLSDCRCRPVFGSPAPGTGAVSLRGRWRRLWVRPPTCTRSRWWWIQLEILACHDRLDLLMEQTGCYLQLSISTGQSWRSSGKYLRFMGHEAVIVILSLPSNVMGINQQLICYQLERIIQWAVVSMLLWALHVWLTRTRHSRLRVDSASLTHTCQHLHTLIFA